MKLDPQPVDGMDNLKGIGIDDPLLPQELIPGRHFNPKINPKHLDKSLHFLLGASCGGGSISMPQQSASQIHAGNVQGVNRVDGVGIAQSASVLPHTSDNIMLVKSFLPDAYGKLMPGDCLRDFANIIDLAHLHCLNFPADFGDPEVYCEACAEHVGGEDHSCRSPYASPKK